MGPNQTVTVVSVQAVIANPPHRTWTCRRCDIVIHNLDPDYGYLPMRPVRLDHQ